MCFIFGKRLNSSLKLKKYICWETELSFEITLWVKLETINKKQLTTIINLVYY